MTNELLQLFAFCQIIIIIIIIIIYYYYYYYYFWQNWWEDFLYLSSTPKVSFKISTSIVLPTGPPWGVILGQSYIDMKAGI